MKSLLVFIAIIYSFNAFSSGWDKLKKNVLFNSVMYLNQPETWFPASLKNSQKYITTSLLNASALNVFGDLPLLPVSVAPSFGVDIGLSTVKCINLENADLSKANRSLILIDNYEKPGNYLKIKSDKYELSLGISLQAEASMAPLWISAGVQGNKSERALTARFVSECRPRSPKGDDKRSFLSKIGIKLTQAKNAVVNKVKFFKVPDSKRLLNEFKAGERLVFQKTGGVRTYISAGISIVTVSSSVLVKGSFIIEIHVMSDRLVRVEVKPVKGKHFKLETGAVFVNAKYEKIRDAFKSYDFEFDFRSKEARELYDKLILGNINVVLDALKKETKISSVRKFAEGEGVTISKILGKSVAIPVIYTSGSKSTESNSHQTTMILKDNLLIDKYIGIFSNISEKKSPFIGLANKVRRSHGVGNFDKESLFLGQVNRIYNPKMKMETFRFLYGANLRYKIEGKKFNHAFFNENIKQQFGRWLGSSRYVEDLEWFLEDKKSLTRYISIDAEIRISNHGLLGLMTLVGRTNFENLEKELYKRVENYFKKYKREDPFDFCMANILVINSDGGGLCMKRIQEWSAEGLKLAFLSLKEMSDAFTGDKLEIFNEALSHFGHGILYNGFVLNTFLSKLNPRHFKGDIVYQGEEFKQVNIPFEEKYKTLSASPDFF